jgi:hypothetical protein
MPALRPGVIIERTGHPEIEKHFLNVGFSESEVDALKEFDSRAWSNPAELPIIYSIRALVQVTLVHYEIMRPGVAKAALCSCRAIPRQWFKVRFSEPEITALWTIKTEVWRNPLAKTARLLVRAALDNELLWEASVRKDFRYIDLEGFESSFSYYQGLLAMRFLRNSAPA